MAHGETSSLDDLPRPMPSGYGNRLFLFVMRRMASAGVNDAHAANAMLGAFGRSYRRPLVLMRAMMLELARASSRKILVAPCCCARMTVDEALMMQATGDALRDPNAAYAHVSRLLGNDHALGALTCLQAVAQAHADLGRPLELYGEG
ncbi:MAG: hypothetical protein EPO45_11850 [Sphingobium sp.]|jgi:hypothetical protein|uniref:DUF6628 family protein n=1 Tax=Sphingobium sp. TaxID=1912891 RepID=UPI000C53AE84|nr:DUF6628 family protein [Sphingobium sp.]MBU0657698.1 hypothetical protein [Alphaproteobacteria bacterium]MBA4756146.1 hypothetical protein [Sphingobium sp.]MBS88042.1 hypothetical protein [Sphingobium sp.]MBU0775075.1 hypothetical protein [Alphaproteobacteria bacterium]MBU1258497.1 hypothetical protein [Alphaproteobacteria bacterium]